MYEIKKWFSFDAAHRIKNHKGKCRNIHGHTYSVCVTLSSDNTNELDVVLDFYDMKPFKEYLDNVFDHSIIISNDDEDLCVALNKLPTKIALVRATTCEHLAEMLFHKAISMFGGIVVSVEVRETPSSGATFYAK